MHKWLSRRKGKKPTPTISGPSPSLPPPIMSPINLENANPQTQCPLFTKLPGEVRNQIFSFAITYHTNKQEPYPKNEYYYRPDFRYADTHLCTTLLRTCRRIYAETKSLPAQTYVRVGWHNRAPPNRPNGALRQLPTAVAAYQPQISSVHLFMQQCELESLHHSFKWVLPEAANLQKLKITLRHSDWWWWERSAALLLDAKRSGQVSAYRYSTSKDPFEERSWGNQLRRLPNLKVFELEMETVEGKRNELDQIVARAAEWQFPSADDDSVLVMNPAKTKKRGWIGLRLPSGTHIPNPHDEAKARLERSGVDFTVTDSEREIRGIDILNPDGPAYYPGYDLLTYYIVTLVYEIRSKPANPEIAGAAGISAPVVASDGSGSGSGPEKGVGNGEGRAHRVVGRMVGG